jgi:hypothetical protein
MLLEGNSDGAGGGILSGAGGMGDGVVTGTACTKDGSRWGDEL